MSTAIDRGHGTYRTDIAPIISSAKKWRKLASSISDTTSIESAWNVWRRHLARRQNRQSVAELMKSSESPLAWSDQPHCRLESAVRQLVRTLGRMENGVSKRKLRDDLDDRLQTWMTDGTLVRPDTNYAVEVLAWTHLSPWIASWHGAEAWWRMIDQLVSLASEPPTISGHRDPLVIQLLVGELPLTLGYLYPELNGMNALAAEGSRFLSESIVDLLDGDGTPHASYLPLVRGLLASWTRSYALAETCKSSRLSAAARTQFAYFLDRVLRLTRADGSPVFSPERGKAAAIPWDLARLATALAGDDETTALAEHTLATKGQKARRPKWKAGLPKDVSCDSEWSELAVLRANWSKNSPRAVVAYADNEFQMELHAGGCVLWSGPCEPVLKIDGQTLPSKHPWSETCWYSDHDIDYLELERDLSDQWIVQRHVALSREDQFFLLADAIIGPQPARIEYSLEMPLGSGLEIHPAAETREAVMKRTSKRAGVIVPMGLPEWRSDNRHGELRSTPGHAHLQQSCDGQRLFAPLFVDLNPKRARAALTWRQLTVAQDLRIVGPDEAVGYRVRSGDENWLIYRSLAQQVPRTVLGQHLGTELLIARVEPTGKAETLVEIE